MAYKAVIMDVDGTLVNSQQHRVSMATVNAVQKLQSMGVIAVIASGRSGFAVSPKMLSGIEPDYCVCVNGALVVDKNGYPIYKDYLDHRLIDVLTRFCEEGGYCLSFSFEDAYYTYVKYQAFHDYYYSNTGDCTYIRNGEDHSRHLKSMPFGAFACLPDEAAAEFCRSYPELQFIPFESGAYDVCKAVTNKATGIEHLLEAIGIGWDEVVAIGDGYNDIQMLKAAGVGIAMGGAPEDVKAAAGIVTKTVAEDGVACALNAVFRLA
ncbi:HAD family hydrolase [Oscillospiraceae bacterium PP1C4]